MSEFAETQKAFREYFREKRQTNKEQSTALLIEKGIKFESRNDGAHLMIETAKGRVNFYPSTGLYNGAFEGRGVFNLLKDLNLLKPEFTEDVFCLACGRRIASGVYCAGCDPNSEWNRR